MSLYILFEGGCVGGDNEDVGEMRAVSSVEVGPKPLSRVQLLEPLWPKNGGKCPSVSL